MSKLITAKIDVTKIDKSKLFKGAKGTYLDLDIWINDEEDQYGNTVSINQSQTKDEREAKAKKNYIGNGKKLFGWEEDNSSASSNSSEDALGEDVPF